MTAQANKKQSVASLHTLGFSPPSQCRTNHRDSPSSCPGWSHAQKLLGQEPHQDLWESHEAEALMLCGQCRGDPRMTEVTHL